MTSKYLILFIDIQLSPNLDLMWEKKWDDADVSYSILTSILSPFKINFGFSFTILSTWSPIQFRIKSTDSARQKFRLFSSWESEPSTWHQPFFNILSDETVTTLLPNQYSNENFLSKDDSLIFPSDEGVINRIRIDIPDGKSQATELILVLAIKADESIKKKNFNLIMGDYNMALKELMKFIMDFPMDQISQINLPYIIKEND